MPANTSPDNLPYPVVGDNLNPLRTWFSLLASAVQTALTNLRAEAVKPALPAPVSVKGNNTQAVTATSWADLPNIAAATLNLPQACWVQITVGAWVVATAGDVRISANVTGATTLGESQIEVGGDSSSWGQVMYAAADTGTRHATSTRVVRLNAGTNTIRVRAYRTSTGGTVGSNYTTLQVAPLYWA